MFNFWKRKPEPKSEPAPLTRKQILILEIAELQEKIIEKQQELKELNPSYPIERSHHKKRS
jgi:hypothetical protein